MKRIFTFVLVLVMVSIGAFLTYADKTYFPIILRQMAIAKAQDFFGRPVSIESARFNLLKGFQVRHLIVFEKNSDKNIFLHVDRLSFNILFVSFLKERKIVIPSLTIQNARLHLIRQKNNQYNFSDLLNASVLASSQKKPSFLIGWLSISDASLELTDQALSPELSEFIENIDFKANFLLKKTASFSLTAGENTALYPYLSAKGEFDYFNQKLLSEIDIRNIHPAKYFSLYMPINDYQMKEGYLKKASIALSFKDGKIDLKSRSDLSGVQISITPDKVYQGNPSVGFDLTYDLKRKGALSYKGFIEPNKSSLRGVPVVSFLNEIDGHIDFDANGFQTDSLNAVALEVPFNLQGNLKDLKNPIFKTNIHSEMDLSKLKAFFPDVFEKEKMETSGVASVRLNAKGQVSKLADSEINLTSTLNMATLKSSRLPYAISDISGVVTYAQDTIAWDDLAAVIAGSPIQSSATIKNLKMPVLNLKVSSVSDLQNLSLLLPDLFQKEKIKTSGTARLSLTYDGPLDLALKPQIQAKVMIENGNLTALKLPSGVSGISGLVTYTNDQLNLKDLKGTFEDHAYILNGSVVNFSKPKFQVSMASDLLNFTSLGDVLRGGFNINSLNGRYLDTEFFIQGMVLFENQTTANLNLAGNLNMKLEDIFKLVPSVRDSAFDKLNPTGPCSVKGSFKGRLSDWPHWQLSTELKSPTMSLGGYKINDVTLKLTPLNSNFHQLEIFAYAYNGPFKINSSFDLSGKGIPGNITLQFNNIDLSKLKDDTGLKDKNFSGFFSGSVQAKGNIKSTDSLEGNGSIEIKNGHIWELGLLQNFGQFLLIPEYRNIVFREAAGDFKIKNNRLLTDNLELKSDPLNLICRGSVDFGGNLDFHLFSQFSRQTIEQSASLKKTITSILTSTDDYLTIRLKGTLQKPEYVILPGSVDVIRKAKDFIINGLQNILQ